MTKPEIFAVVWVDRVLGPLTLLEKSAAAAIASAQAMRKRGEGKIDDVRAVHVPENKDSLIVLDEVQS